MTKTIGLSLKHSSNVGDPFEGCPLRAALVVGGIPNTVWGGGAVTAYGIAAALKNRGFHTAVFHWEEREGLFEKGRAQLNALGVEEVRLKRQAPDCKGSGLFPSKMILPDEVVFPFLKESGVLKRALLDWSPDIVVAYHWEALAAMSSLDRWPVCGYVGDPLDAVHRHRRSEGSERGVRKHLRRFWTDRWHRIPQRQRQKMAEWLNRCEDSGAFAAHHAQELRTCAARCRYVRTPLAASDGFNAAFARRIRRDESESGETRFVLLGHMNGIATLTGLRFFFEEVFPRWVRAAAGRRWSIHVIGDGYDRLPGALQKAMDHPQVDIRGHVWPIEAELEKATALLVPTPVRLGIRVRIITAFCCGTPVIAHEANNAGIPELEHGINAWLARDAEEMVEGMSALTSRPDLRRRLAFGGRTTYNSFFSLETAGKELVDRVTAVLMS